MSADECCADQESRRNLEAVSATLVSTVPLAMARLLPVRRQARGTVAPRPFRGRPETYLLDSVFLI